MPEHQEGDKKNAGGNFSRDCCGKLEPTSDGHGDGKGSSLLRDKTTTCLVEWLPDWWLGLGFELLALLGVSPLPSLNPNHPKRS